MVFYINKTKIIIQYSFLLIIAFSLLINNKNILYVVLFSSLHETAHILSLIIFHQTPEEITFAFYGIGLKSDYSLSFFKELVFLLIGALLNLLLAFFGVFREINYSLAIINLLPIYPLDGGRALKLILNKVFSLDFSDRLFRWVSALIILSLIAYSLYNKNYSLILIVIYILIFSFNNSFE